MRSNNWRGHSGKSRRRSGSVHLESTTLSFRTRSARLVLEVLQGRLTEQQFDEALADLEHPGLFPEENLTACSPLTNVRFYEEYDRDQSRDPVHHESRR